MHTDTSCSQNKNILLVEDDSRDLELTMAALAKHDLDKLVTVVRDGAEALDYLYRRGKFRLRPNLQPSVVLLDNKMPKINGLEVLKIMKADEQLKTIPVVALTSSRETPDLMDFYKHGVNAYVVKPLDFFDFTEVVKQLGIFWTSTNETPPNSRKEETPKGSDEAAYSRKKKITNEIPASHSTLAR
jgi:CheY-like chemotaxis protein